MFVVDSRAIVLVSRDDTHTFLFPMLCHLSARSYMVPHQNDLKAEVILKENVDNYKS